MAVTALEVIKTNLVMLGIRLLAAQEEFEAFRLAVGVDVLAAGAGLATNIQSGIAEPVLGLTLNRDRITMELSPTRAVISRDYPVRQDLHRLAEVAGQAINNTDVAGQQTQAYGFNIELVFDQDSGEPAFEYLSRRLFDADPLGNEGWQFVGGAGRIVFDDSGRRWTINLEPRFNSETESRVFLNANLNINERTTPDEAIIRAWLEEVWDKMELFVQRLDEREDRNG